MNEHTPGPWEVINGSDGRLRVADCNPQRGSLVVELLRIHDATTCGTNTELANARLIAAAPDLLAACQLLAEMGRFANQQLEADGIGWTLDEGRLTEAEALIARIEGAK